MNAHVLRKRSLAKNRIFILMPVLTLLVSWCQCFSVATTSSVPLQNLRNESINTNDLADVTLKTGIYNVNIQTDPKEKSSQKLANYQNNKNENENLFIQRHYKPNARQTMFGRNNERTPSDFKTRDFLRKRNRFAWQKRFQMQQIQHMNGELHRNNLHQRLRMLPNTTNSYSSFKRNSHTHSNSLIYNPNSNYSNQIIAIERRNAFDHSYNTDASSSSLSSLSSLSSSSLSSSQQIQRNSFRNSDEMFDHDENADWQRRYQMKRSRRESMPKLTRHTPFSYSRFKSQSFGSVNAARPRRFCTARDPTTLAFEAPTVFEGKVRSMSSDRRQNFSVTFEVKEIFKQQVGPKLPSLVRLKFTYKNSSECDIYRETFRSIGHVRDELEPGKLYILFVNRINLGNYTILGQPAKLTRKTVSDVRTGVAEKYGQRAYIESLVANNVTIKEGKRLRIVCKVRGRPPPKVTWFKDNRSIAKNRSRYQFIHLRRRSELIIKAAFINDSGQYECRAKNKLARQPIRKFTKIEVLPKDYTRHSSQQINWTHSGSTCPVIGNAFCLNGGTCVFFKDVGEPACKCPDGFLGNRCETKNPTNIHSSTYRNNQEIRQQQHQCGENNFYGSYYC